MNIYLKRHPVWLECLPAPNPSGNLLLLGGDGQQVAVPVPLLLAVSPVVRSILTDHLPPAYSPCCLTLPAATGDALQLFGDILATGAAAGAHVDKVEEIRQVFKMLGVEASMVSCHFESIQVGQVLDMDLKQECFDEEDSCWLESDVETEHIEDIGVEEDDDDSNRLSPSKKFNLISQGSSIASAHDKMKIPCSLCQKLLRKKNLLRHIKSVHEKITFPCDLCPEKFSQKDNLSRHVKTVHDKIKYSCNLCPKKFTNKVTLLVHVKSVHHVVQDLKGSKKQVSLDEEGG